MRTSKKVLTSCLVLLLLLCMAVPAFAVEIELSSKTSCYSAYRLFDLVTHLKLNDYCEGEHTRDCYEHIYSVNEKYRDALQAVFTACYPEADVDGNGACSDEEYFSYLEFMSLDQVQLFSERLFSKIKDTPVDALTAEGMLRDLPQGYYLITEQAPDSAGVVSSTLLVSTGGVKHLKLYSKSGTPTLIKQVKHQGRWTNGTDAAISGDLVPFKLTGTVPEGIEGFDKYYYAFHDTMCEGLSFDASSLSVRLEGVTVPSSKYALVTSSKDGCSFEVVIEDLIKVAQELGLVLSSTTVCEVTYDTTLNTRAVVGSPGNLNTALLEFSCDPYNEGVHNKTPLDAAVVFTFGLSVDKTDNFGNALAGAEFVLSRLNAATGTYEACRPFDVNAQSTQFYLSGLSAGKYLLSEQVAPEGYTKADDIYFELLPGYDPDADRPVLTSLSVGQAGDLPGDSHDFVANISTGSVSTKVVNTLEETPPEKLPYTGGEGRTAGVVIAAVCVVSGLGLFGYLRKSRKHV